MSASPNAASLELALSHYQAAVAAQPNEPGLRSNLAALLSQLGRHREAVEEADRALALDPSCAPALYNQANSLLALGETRRACERLLQCSSLSPDDPKVHNNLGLALAADHQYEQALRSFDRALQLRPDYARALNNRATSLMSLERLEEAVADLERALQLEPTYTQALLNHGAALRALGRDDAALVSYQKALPVFDALENMTEILVRKPARATEALVCATELYLRAPGHDHVAGTYHAASQTLAKWDDYEARVATITAGVRAGRPSSTPFRMLYVTDSAPDQLQCARLIAQRFRPRAPLWRGEIYSHPRIRVAYLSSDFYSHATAYLAAGLFESHDRDRFECFALSHGDPYATDPMRVRLQSAFEHFEDVHPLSIEQIAERVRALEIDILVDMKGYTADTRVEVLSHRPAPVQAHYLGYPGTSGAAFVDYLIADSHVIPESAQESYSEKIARLPHTYQVTDDRRLEASEPWTRERAGLPATGLVLAAFHQTYKLSPPVFDVWMRVMRQRPDSYLWLLDKNPAARSQLLQAAAARGVEPSRLVFAPVVSQVEHLSRQRLADLLLDTWPYGSHTTASDALWMGLPVVALSGRSFAARVSGSILCAAGLSDLVCESLADYESLIMKICATPGQLRNLRERVEAGIRASPLFATAAFTRALEGLYEQMYARYQAGLPPAHLQG
jgi:predicted O-linked N-acetylglucosamine transferase (SPINDLY family)